MHKSKFIIGLILAILCIGSIPNAFGIAIEEKNGSQSPTPIILQNNQWEIKINPDTFEIAAQVDPDILLTLSSPLETKKSATMVATSKTETEWSYPDEKITVRIALKNDFLSIKIRAEDPGTFTWPIIRKEDSLRALIWPQNEGSYIPLDDTQWLDFLSNNTWNTLEGLSMPFWGLEYHKYILTYIITNPFNNKISFTNQNNKVSMFFQHEFPPNHAEKEYGFQIYLSSTQSPIEPAKKFREELIKQGKFITLSQKIKRTPNAEQLLGAPHVYLWGQEVFTQYDVPRQKWPAFCKRIIEESTVDYPTTGKKIKGMVSVACWKSILELSTTQYAYPYIMNEVASGISLILSNPDFYGSDLINKLNLPAEAKDLVNLDKSKLTIAQLTWLNSIIFHAAYSEYVLPVDLWGNGVSQKMFTEFKTAGFERMLLCLDGWSEIEKRPQLAQRANELGYLFGTYDSFHSIHNPKLQGTDNTWPTAQFNQKLYETGAIMNRNGERIGGFKQRGYKLSPIAARPDVEERVNQNMQKVPYTYYFVDCDAYGEYYDDYTPGRIVTQQEDALARVSRLQWIRDTYNVTIGSEGGNYLFAPVLHVAEGIFIPVIGWGDPDMNTKSSPYYLGRYYPANGPEVFTKQVPLKDKYVYLYYDPRFRLPLYETVFHDSLITSCHWGSSSLKFSNVWKSNALMELLYQVPPLYHLNLELWKQYKGIIQKHYQYFAPSHRKTAVLPMTDFQWLTPDRLVQKTRFADSIEIISNFSGIAYQHDKQTVPPQSVLLNDLKENTYNIYTP